VTDGPMADVSYMPPPAAPTKLGDVVSDGVEHGDALLATSSLARWRSASISPIRPAGADS
jgi:hypothetical protein